MFNSSVVSYPIQTVFYCNTLRILADTYIVSLCMYVSVDISTVLQCIAYCCQVVIHLINPCLGKMIPAKHCHSGLNPWIESHQICTECVSLEPKWVIEIWKHSVTLRNKYFSCTSRVLDRKSLYIGLYILYKNLPSGIIILTQALSKSL